MVLLDLSAAFDTIDHKILLSRLSSFYGLSNTALNLIASYLLDRTQSVSIQSHSTPPSNILTSIPQGSVLGPLLFSLYTSPISQIFTKKAVFYVGNIDGQFQSEHVRQYIEKNLAIDCLSCYDLSLKNKSGEDSNRNENDASDEVSNPKTKIKQSKGFRVCIKAIDKTKFLTLDKWPQDVIIRNWSFKAKSDDKDVRKERNGEIVPVDVRILNSGRKPSNPNSTPDQGRTVGLWSEEVESVNDGISIHVQAEVHAAADRTSVTEHYHDTIETIEVDNP